MMITKKAIADQFRANEAFASSLGSLTSIIKNGRYNVLNNSGQYETIHLETSANQVIENYNKRFVSDIEKEKWNNKAEKLGNVSQDFSAKTFNVSNAILPTTGGIDIGSPQKRFRGIYVDEAYLSTNTLYIGDTPILGTNDDTITIKADPNQSITMQTKATGTTKIISEAGVELSTSGMNADVVLQATGVNAQVKIGSTGSTHIDAANINIKGDTTFKNSIKIDGDLTVTGPNTTLSTSNLVIKDNIIELNHGQTGSSVSEGKAGIKINRGDSYAFNILFDESDDCLKVGAISSLKTVALQEWVDSTTAKKNHTHDYLSLTGGNLTGNLTIKNNKVYHAGDKPTADEIGAAAKSHGNHVPTTQTADDRKFLRNDNTWQSLPSATTSATGIVQLNDATNSTSITQAATANAVKKAYDLANSKANSSHGHNNLSSRGVVAMESSTTRPAVAGLSMTEVYSNGYPTTYGNTITMKGKGDSQLLIGWAGTSGAHAPAYIRSKRDMADATWSEWAQIYTTAYKPSLTDLGISTLQRGSYLTGGNYNGTEATTWAVDATTAATANKVVARDGNADVFARLFKSNYANENTISGAMAFRANNSDNNSIRFCSDTGAIRTFLNTYAKNETYNRNEMDNRYRQKTDLVFTDTISIITPAA